MERIKTPWFDKVDRNCPLNDYPTPQFQRKDWLCLNGEYDYAITDLQAITCEEFEGKILVPFAVESEMSEVQRPLTEHELLWYRRKFTLTPAFEGKRTLLHFGAVDWKCTVFINGKVAGEHTGGYNPFKFDITELLVEGENELIVKVFDPTDAGHQQRGKQKFDTIGFWYTATSGIWQTVWAEPVSENRLESVRLVPDIDKEVIKITANIVGEGKLSAKIFEGETEIFSGEISTECEIPVKNPKLWSPESPFLYDIKFSLNEGEDEVSSYFGMRKYSIIKDDKDIPRLGLNNKPYFQRGLLDQGYWPESQLTPPTDEVMIFDIAEMKRLGFNMLRKHIKLEPMRWYYHCDKLGMLVWQDMISGGKPLNLMHAGVIPFFNIHVKDNQYKTFNRDLPEWREEFKQELFEMIDNLYSCVSLCTWVPFNEGWGQFDAKEIGEKVKQVDPTRFCDHASGWHDQMGPDFKSVHRYVVPIHKPTKFRTAGRPYVISEYGGYSWNIKDHVWNEAKSFGYLMFRSSKTLSNAYRRLHTMQVIPLIKKGLCATVYTQISDVEHEVNGIYSYDRKVLKIDEKVLKDINSKLTY